MLLLQSISRTTRNRVISSNMSLQKYSTLDVIQYIDAIEKEVLEVDTFTGKIRPQNKKPLIRTLINLQQKVEFDSLLRIKGKQVEYERVKSFCLNHLQPIIQSLSEEEKQQKLPNYDEALENAIKSEEKEKVLFYKLASGRAYKGKLTNLVSDLAPDQIQNCQESTMAVDDDEALMSVIDHVANDSSLEFERKDERIKAAKDCVNMFRSIGTERVNFTSKVNGIKCEQACINWLQDRDVGPQFPKDNNNVGPKVLPNVNINGSSSKARQKYERYKKGNIIWTQEVPDRTTSELDAIVLDGLSSIAGNNSDTFCEGTSSSANENNMFISEFWEAKFSISPSSLYDTLSKKAPAIVSLMKDENLTISYDGKNHHLHPYDSGNSNSQVILGVFGNELLSPLNAVGQLRSIAVSAALNSDIDVGINAVKNGEITIKPGVLLEDLRKLREKYVFYSQLFDIIVLAPEKETNEPQQAIEEVG